MLAFDFRENLACYSIQINYPQITLRRCNVVDKLLKMVHFAQFTLHA